MPNITKVLTDAMEIANFLKGVRTKRSIIWMWQNDHVKNKIIVKSKIQNIDVMKNQVLFTPQKKEKYTDFLEGKGTIFCAEDENWVCQILTQKVYDESLTAELPIKLVFYEKSVIETLSLQK